MKRERTYRTYLRLVSTFVLSLLLIILNMILYHDTLFETQSMLHDSVQVNLHAANYQIGREFSLLYNICETLQNNENIAEHVQVCAQKDVSRVMLERANSNLVSILNSYIYRCQSIGAIYIETPARVIEACERYRTFHYQMAEATNEIKMYGDGQGAFRISFLMNNEPGCPIHIELKENAMQNLLRDTSSILVRNSKEGICIEQTEEDPSIPAEAEISFAFNASDSIGTINRFCFAKAQMLWGWELITFLESEPFFHSYRQMFFLSLFIGLLSIVLAFVLCNGISRVVIKPLHSLINKVKRAPVIEDVSFSESGIGLREGFFLSSVISVSAGVMMMLCSFALLCGPIQTTQKLKLSEATLTAIGSSIEETMEEIKDETLRIAFDNKTSTYIKSRKNADLKNLEDFIRINAPRLSSSANISFIDQDRNTIYSSSALNIQNVLPIIGFGDWQISSDSFGQLQLVLISHVHEAHEYLQVSYDCRLLALQISELLQQQNSVYMVSENGQFVYGTDHFPDDATLLSRKIEDTPLTLHIRCETMTPLENVYMMFRNNSELIIALLLSAIILTSILSSVLVNPLSKMTRTVQNISKGEIGALQAFSDNHYPISELNELNNSFVEMSDHIEKLIDDLVNSRNHLLMLENEKKIAEINALQMQITPHFLSNTIIMIADRMKAGSIDEGINTLYAMNDLFRFGISRKELLISVEEEWNYAQAYTRIMEARKRHIRFEWHIDDQAVSRSTIRLILQPILENAIIHGFKNDGTTTTIRVSCSAEKDSTVFIVQDDGPGLSQEKIAYLRQSLNAEVDAARIGLYNVQARIRLYCGDEYGISLRNAEEGGAIFIIRIPAVFEKLL